MGETPYKKKLIEVALPLEAINAASAREKSIRHGLAIWLRPINRTIIFAPPPTIAETIYHVTHQERSAWTFDVDLRPFGEVW